MATAAQHGHKWTLLMDLSGTLHIEDQALPGALEALEKLREMQRQHDVRLKFVTNTTKESGRILHERLTKLGFKIEKHEIFTSLSAARRLVDRLQLKPMLLLEEIAMEEFNDLNNAPDKPPNAVVIGLAPSKFNYQSMNDAFRLLMADQPSILIGIHKARYFRVGDGQLALGPGAYVEALEFATDKKARIVGKPEREFFENAIYATINANNDETRDTDKQELINRAFMIGDDVKDDIEGAQKAGIRGILIKTGKYRLGDEKKIAPAPWATVDNVLSAVQCIEMHINEELSKTSS